jgi:hypothetical protein
MITQMNIIRGKTLMKTLFTHGLLLGLLVLPVISYSYEIETHQEITRHAVKEAEIFKDQGKYLSDLGITNPYDPVGTKFPNSKFELLSIVDLFAYGAKYEDIATACVYGNYCERVFNHFFDPSRTVEDQALHFSLPAVPFYIAEYNPYTPFDPLNPQSFNLVKSYTSPDWTLEDKEIIDGTKWYGGGQNYSWRDARQYFYLALTSEQQTERQNYFGSLFQTLGHVVHHLQDMAQPQHVRNDPHNDINDFLVPYQHASLFESFTNNASLLPKLPYTNPPYSNGGSWKPAYSASDVNVPYKTPREFWTSLGRGIADFTQHNFFSSGTNADTNYGVPSINDKIEVTLNGACALYSQAISWKFCFDPVILSAFGDSVLKFYSTRVDNLRTGTSGINSYATTSSIFDADLETVVGQRVYTINSINMGAALDFLIPEATAYSTGLINFFFRGKIDMVEDPDPAHSDQYLIKNLGNEPLTGTFELYYDSPDGKTRTFVKSWDLSIESGKSAGPITFPSPDPKPSSYLLVFIGDMGKETREMSGWPGESGLLDGGAVAAKKVLAQHIGIYSPPVWTPVVNSDGTPTNQLTKPGEIIKRDLGTGDSTTLYTGNNITAMTYDTAGNLYFVEMAGSTSANSKLKKIAAGSTLPVDVDPPIYSSASPDMTYTEQDVFQLAYNPE